MKLFGLTITRTSHYENLVKEVTTLAISNVKLIKENTKYELVCDEAEEILNAAKKSYRELLGIFSILDAKLSLIESINDELQNKLIKKNAPRNEKINHKPKCVRIQKCRRK